MGMPKAHTATPAPPLALLALAGKISRTQTKKPMNFFTSLIAAYKRLAGKGSPALAESKKQPAGPGASHAQTRAIAELAAEISSSPDPFGLRGALALSCARLRERLCSELGENAANVATYRPYAQEEEAAQNSSGQGPVPSPQQSEAGLRSNSPYFWRNALDFALAHKAELECDCAGSLALLMQARRQAELAEGALEALARSGQSGLAAELAQKAAKLAELETEPGREPRWPAKHGLAIAGLQEPETRRAAGEISGAEAPALAHGENEPAPGSLLWQARQAEQAVNRYGGTARYALGLCKIFNACQTMATAACRSAEPLTLPAEESLPPQQLALLLSERDNARNEMEYPSSPKRLGELRYTRFADCASFFGADAAKVFQTLAPEDPMRRGFDQFTKRYAQGTAPGGAPLWIIAEARERRLVQADSAEKEICAFLGVPAWSIEPSVPAPPERWLAEPAETRIDKGPGLQWGASGSALLQEWRSIAEKERERISNEELNASYSDDPSCRESERKACAAASSALLAAEKIIDWAARRALPAGDPWKCEQLPSFEGLEKAAPRLRLDPYLEIFAKAGLPAASFENLGPGWEAGMPSLLESICLRDGLAASGSATERKFAKTL